MLMELSTHECSGSSSNKHEATAAAADADAGLGPVCSIVMS